MGFDTDTSNTFIGVIAGDRREASKRNWEAPDTQPGTFCDYQHGERYSIHRRYTIFFALRIYDKF